MEKEKNTSCSLEQPFEKPSSSLSNDEKKIKLCTKQFSCLPFQRDVLGYDCQAASQAGGPGQEGDHHEVA